MIALLIGTGFFIQSISGLVNGSTLAQNGSISAPVAVALVQH